MNSLDAVLRIDSSVPNEAIVCALGMEGYQISRVIRFEKTSRQHSRPLPLVRVFCDSEGTLKRLCTLGASLFGVHVIGEQPKHATGSPAALGKLSTICEENQLRNVLGSYRATLHPEDLPELCVGCLSYSWPRGGRFFRGAHCTFTSDISKLHQAWPVMSTSSCAPEGVVAAPPLLLICSETDDYRRAARAEIFASDVVLEIGSDLGTCCDVISRNCGQENVVGVDLSSSSVARARKLFPGIMFRVLDVLKVGAGLEFRNIQTLLRGPFSKVLLDINGNRLLGAVCRVLEVVLEELHPNTVIVKSRELHQAMGNMRQR